MTPTLREVFAFFSPDRREAVAPSAAPSRAAPALQAARRGVATTGIDGMAPAARPARERPQEREAASPVASVLDGYIAARFPGFAGSAERLEDTEQVIRTARLYFEEQKTDRAQELLHLAIVRSPANKALRLAQLELAFLTADGPLFTGLARQFRATHPESTDWSEIGRLGRAIAPGESLFGANPGARAHEHYGPWPDMPNWIQASWDLTSEVLAADFHRAMASPATAGKQKGA